MRPIAEITKLLMKDANGLREAFAEANRSKVGRRAWIAGAVDVMLPMSSQNRLARKPHL